MVEISKICIGKIALAFACSLIVVGPTACTGPARMQDAAENATKWGILGTWQSDCQAPISEANYAYAYVVRDGQLFFDRVIFLDHVKGIGIDDFRGLRKDSHLITNATVTNEGSFAAVINFQKATLENVIVKGTDGRIRVMQNKNINTNEYDVKDGILLEKGEPTRWLSRCR